MAFHSILYETPRAGGAEGTEGQRDTADPPFFADLNLGQVVDAIIAGREEYDLRGFFIDSLDSVKTVEYRQEVMRELECKVLFRSVTSFAQAMRAMREHLTQAKKLYYQYQQERWFLDAVGIYCQAVTTLAGDLASLDLKSRGFLAFSDYLATYEQSEGFLTLARDVEQLQADLRTVKYSLFIKGNRVTVRKREEDADYGAEVEETFRRFKQGAVKSYRVAFPNWPEMNHVEAAVLDMVARFYPDVFLNLDAFPAKHGDYLDPTVAAFDREVQFYLAFLEYIAPLRGEGLEFCYPAVSDTDKQVRGREVFDLALATRLTGEKVSVVRNDFRLSDPERIFVVTGPNQGGKTTFARAFGQLHHLASLGCPVPGKEARLFLFDRVFTHFEKEESIDNLRSKLEDDLVRLHSILQQSTSKSIILINEVFSSTTLTDALYLGQKIIERIVQLDCLAVYVTFIDELAALSEKTVSLVSTVRPENPDLRTYKVVRRPADGRSYAIAIARKHGLTYENVKERLLRERVHS